MIGRKTIRFQEYLIIDFTGLKFYTTSYEIVKNYGFTFWYFQTNRILFSFLNPLFRFLDRYMSTMSIIFWWKFEFFLFFFECLKPFTRAKTIVCSPLFTESMKSRCIGIESFALNIRSIGSSVSDALIWSKSKEIVDIKNSIDSTFYQTRTICIFYTYDILSIIVSRPKIGIECRSQVTDVYGSSWWWSQSGADSHRSRI